MMNFRMGAPSPADVIAGKSRAGDSAACQKPAGG